jgi:hypothetical protein
MSLSSTVHPPILENHGVLLFFHSAQGAVGRVPVQPQDGLQRPAPPLKPPPVGRAPDVPGRRLFVVDSLLSLPRSAARLLPRFHWWHESVVISYPTYSSLSVRLITCLTWRIQACMCGYHWRYCMYDTRSWKPDDTRQCATLSGLQVQSIVARVIFPTKIFGVNIELSWNSRKTSFVLVGM